MTGSITGWVKLFVKRYIFGVKLKRVCKKKGFVLASTLVSIVVITMVSFLMITLVTTTTVSNRYLSNYSNKKIILE